MCVFLIYDLFFIHNYKINFASEESYICNNVLNLKF